MKIRTHDGEAFGVSFEQHEAAELTIAQLIALATETLDLTHPDELNHIHIVYPSLFIARQPYAKMVAERISPDDIEWPQINHARLDFETRTLNGEFSFDGLAFTPGVRSISLDIAHD